MGVIAKLSLVTCPSCSAKESTCQQKQSPYKLSHAAFWFFLLGFIWQSEWSESYSKYLWLKITISVMIASPSQLNLLLTKDLSTWKQNSEVWFCHLCLWLRAVEVHNVCTSEACVVSLSKSYSRLQHQYNTSEFSIYPSMGTWVYVTYWCAICIGHWKIVCAVNYKWS